MRQATLLGAVFLVILVLNGCEPDNDPKGLGGGKSVPGGRLPHTTDAASPAEKPPTEMPRIDVIIQKIDMPAKVNRNQQFELTLELENITLGTSRAGVANVNIRAFLNHPAGHTDIPIGSAQFRDLRPREPQRRTIRVKAPHMTGLWTVDAVIEPFDFIDDANNKRETKLAVN